MEKIIVNFGEFEPFSLNLGDIIVENYGSFKKSKPYIVTKIDDDVIVAKNKNKGKNEIKFNIKSFGSFPQFLKLNIGIDDNDEFRNQNLKSLLN